MNHATRWITIVFCLLLLPLLIAQHADEHEHDGHDNGKQQHADHEEHPGEEHGHESHDDHEPGVVELDAATLKEFDIEIASAGSGMIARMVSLPGEVVYNADRTAHVTPTVSGIVSEVGHSVGNHVEKGQTMAVLNSRELAAARSEYLAAKARHELARENLQRDERLLRDQVGTEKAVLASRQAVKDAQIDLNQADYALHALGYTHQQIEQIESLDEAGFNAYELKAPLAGIVTQRHLTVGEVVEPTGDQTPFIVADLSTVWVNLTVYQRDLASVKSGQQVELQFKHGIPDARGKIAFISPALDESTRTATARIVLDNADRHWKPGLFVTARIEVNPRRAEVVIPRTALQTVDQQTVVFVQTDHGFKPRPVQVGRTTKQRAEIVKGLSPGERFAATNALAIKAELNRAALEHAGHSH